MDKTFFDKVCIKFKHNYEKFSNIFTLLKIPQGLQKEICLLILQKLMKNSYAAKSKLHNLV